jgi:hypothetical protein
MASRDQQERLGLAELVESLFPPEIEMVEFVRSGGPLAPEAVSRIAPDLQVEFLPRVLGGGIGAQGLAGLTEGWQEWVEPYESYVITMERFEQLNDEDVLVLVRARARTHRDHVLVEHAPAALATVRDGLLVRMRFYLDPDAARADAAKSGKEKARTEPL